MDSLSVCPYDSLWFAVIPQCAFPTIPGPPPFTAAAAPAAPSWCASQGMSRRTLWNRVELSMSVYTLFIHCLYIVYTLFIHCLYIVYTLFIHCLYIVYTLFIHCLYIVYTLFIHCLYIVYTLFIHCLYIVYTLFIHCLYIVYTLFIHCLYIVYTLFILFLSSRKLAIDANAMPSMPMDIPGLRTWTNKSKWSASVLAALVFTQIIDLNKFQSASPHFFLLNISLDISDISQLPQKRLGHMTASIWRRSRHSIFWLETWQWCGRLGHDSATGHASTSSAALPSQRQSWGHSASFCLARRRFHQPWPPKEDRKTLDLVRLD